MNPAPYPLVFEPQLVPKPWGGRQLERFGKRLPEGQWIGESWELSGLPQRPTPVRDGPLAGRTPIDLLQLWGDWLLGSSGAKVRMSPRSPQGRETAAAQDRGLPNEFPLLIKLLDARADLSVQVHPRPGQSGVKHEFWYVCHAEPAARLLAGLRPGVTPAELERAAGSRAVVDLLQSWPVRAGDCLWLPSGTPHALGAGIVVAEVQQPSDVTYRLYDWDRTDAAGRPRTLHVAEAISATASEPCRGPVRAGEGPISPPPTLADPPFAVALHRPGDRRVDSAAGRLRIWLLTSGRVELVWEGGHIECGSDTPVLLPAALGVSAAFSGGEFLEITLPQQAASPPARSDP